MNSLRPASRHAVVFGALVTALVTPALAQEQGAEIEEIVVTGSYLYTGVDSPSPVTVFSGEDMVNFAPADIATFFFDNVPQNYTADNIDQTDAMGMARSRGNRNSSINLRGLGDENSLAVLNGRRTIGYPVPDGAGWNRVDINSLVPRIAIQRVELLLDGGSAIFGSDPVAGVANFVTRNSFRGFDIALDTRTLEEATDGKNITASMLFGAGNDDTNIMVAFEFHQEDRILQREVNPVYQGVDDVTPETGTGLEHQEGLLYSNRVGGMGMGSVNWVDPLCGDPVFGGSAYYPSLIDAAGEIRETTLAQATDCSRAIDFSDGFRLINNNVKQLIAFVHAEHNFSDALRINAEFNFSRQRFGDIDMWGDSDQARVWSPSTPASLGTAYAFPATHPGLLHAQSLDPGFGLDGMGNPAPVYSLDETMPFLSELDAFNRADVFRVALGLEGDINNWTWLVDTSVAYSEVDNGARDPIVAFYPDAIAGLGGPECDPVNGLPGQGSCFYYNPFMSSALPNAASIVPAGATSQTGLANNPDMLNWLIPNRVDHFEGEFFSVDARLTGEFGELPGGPIGLAVGVAYREDSLLRDADASVNAGATASVGIVNDYSGKQSVDSLYFEFALPVHEDVNLQIAARYEEYDIGFSEVSPKIAALWTPTDRLSLRASWGTSFKAPSITQSAASTQFQAGGRNGITVGMTFYGAMGMFFAAFETRANPDLLPQTSDNLSLGFDFSVTDNIDVGATWVSIAFENRIVSPGGNTVSQSLDCIVTDANGNPIEDANGNLNWIAVADGGCMVPKDPSIPIDQFNVGLIISQPINLGFLDADFVDLHARMVFDTGIGQLSFNPSVTLVTKYEFPLPEGTGGRDGLCPAGVCSAIARTIGMGFASGIANMPRWQGNFPVTLTTGDHSFRVNAAYRDSLNDDVDDLAPDDAAIFVHEEGQWTVDVQWAWQVSEGTSIGFSTRNLFATEPRLNSTARFNQRMREYSLQFRHSLGN